MNNKFRLKINYREYKVTIDVDENLTFAQLKDQIDGKLYLNKVRDYQFIKDSIVIDNNETRKKSICLKEKLEIGQELVYIRGKKQNSEMIRITVWDHILDINDETMKKFVKMMKKVNQVRPKQRYYLNKGQRRFLDNALLDCYETLKEHNFGGKYNYRLLKNGQEYVTIKLIYYMLDDKYEIHIYQNKDDLKNECGEYLITFYDQARAYFKGYQGVNRNIFVLHGEKNTIKANEFEYLYNVLNRLNYMFKDVDRDFLFLNHDKYLIYDVASMKYWLEK